MTTQRVRVGDVLAADRRPVSPTPSCEYVSIGVRSFGKGIFHYEPKRGDQLGKLRFYSVPPDRLVISNIKGWEGAIAVSGPEDSETIASNRFLIYEPRDTKIDLNWAKWFFLSEVGLPLIQQASPGSADRNRTLAIERFENLEIPLPPIDTQLDVAARLDLVARTSARHLGQHEASVLELCNCESAAVRALIAAGIESGWPMRPLSEVALINPSTERVRPGETVAFVPMSAVDAETGEIVSDQAKLARDVGTGYKHFQQDDVIFARITPCMQNGKTAVFRGPQQHGFGSTEFHVIRPGPEVTSEWLQRVMRTTDFRNMAVTKFTGTAGQQRVPAAFLQGVEIPVPPTTTEQAHAVAALDEVAGRFRQLRCLRARCEVLSRALLPSALNEAFADLT